MLLPFSSEDRVLGKDEEFSLPANYPCCWESGREQVTWQNLGYKDGGSEKITDFVALIGGE